jgi:hypothetical protein
VLHRELLGGEHLSKIEEVSRGLEREMELVTGTSPVRPLEQNSVERRDLERRRAAAARRGDWVRHGTEQQE